MDGELSYSKVPEYPEEEFKDTLTKWMKVGLNLIPGFGGSAAEVFGILVTPKLEKRREQFLRDLLIHIERLSRTVEAFKPEKLKENDVFISMLQEATRIAVKSHQKEKHEALRNATLNNVLDTKTDDDTNQIYLRILESITPTHINLLIYFIHNQSWENDQTPSVLYKSYLNYDRHLEIELPIFTIILEDLVALNLLNKKNSPPAFGFNEFQISYTISGISNEFICFISEPKIESL